MNQKHQHSLKVYYKFKTPWCTLNLQHQNGYFNNILGWLVCPVIFEKHWFRDILKIYLKIISTDFLHFHRTDRCIIVQFLSFFIDTQFLLFLFSPSLPLSKQHENIHPAFFLKLLKELDECVPVSIGFFNLDGRSSSLDFHHLGNWEN